MIPGLDGLRAISVLSVFLFHIDGYKYGFGWLGVQFFFVLSGFLITGVLFRMKEKLPAKQYFYKFYGRRFLRILPLYYLYLLIVVILVLLANLPFLEPFRDDLQTVVRPQLPYVFFNVYDFFYATSKYQVSAFLTHFWSLSVEEQFYIVWPLLILLTPKKNVRALFLVTIILGPVFRLITYVVYEHRLFSFLLPNPHLAILALPFSHIDAFAMGAYISQFEITKPRKQLIIMAGLVPFLGYFSQYMAAGIIDISTLGYEFKMFTAHKFIWGYSLVNYLFALIIYNVYQMKFCVRVLENVVLRFIGKISYGVYVYHIAVLYFTSKIIPFDTDSPFYELQFYLTAVILTVIISSLSFYLLEKPITNLKDKFFSLNQG